MNDDHIILMHVQPIHPKHVALMKENKVIDIADQILDNYDKKPHIIFTFYKKSDEEWKIDYFYFLPKNKDLLKVRKKDNNLLIDTTDHKGNPNPTFLFKLKDIEAGKYKAVTLDSDYNALFFQTTLFPDPIFIKKSESQNNLEIKIRDRLANNNLQFRDIATLAAPHDHSIITFDVNQSGTRLLILYKPKPSATKPFCIQIINLDFQTTFRYQIYRNNKWSAWLYRHKGKIALGSTLLGTLLYKKFLSKGKQD